MARAKSVKEVKQAKQPTLEATVTDETLNDTPVKVVAFLRGVGTKSAIAGILATRGYNDDEHTRGWLLLQHASGYTGARLKSTGTSEAARKAMVELDQWDESGFRISRAALKTDYPAQCEFVFDGLAASQGPQSVVGVELYLNRLDALENSKDRTKTREEDHKALAKLSRRGVTAVERKRLRGLVVTAITLGQGVPEEPAGGSAADAAHHAALVELRAWYEEWADVAHSVIRRRDYLILLGLAQRKPHEADGNGGGTAPPAK